MIPSNSLDRWDSIQAARRGTLFIGQIEYLAPRNQRVLCGILKEQSVLSGDGKGPAAMDIRIIASAGRNLRQLAGEGRFLPELCFLLAALTLVIPPLRERPEDVGVWADRLFARSCQRYSRYLTLTEAARARLLRYRWDGNLFQLEGFCRRLAVNAPKKVIDENYVQEELDAAYPEWLPPSARKESAACMDPKAAELMRLMGQCKGNRTQVAKELGISKTTLWRRLKKYGLEV